MTIYTFFSAGLAIFVMNKPVSSRSQNTGQCCCPRVLVLVSRRHKTTFGPSWSGLCLETAGLGAPCGLGGVVE